MNIYPMELKDGNSYTDIQIHLPVTMKTYQIVGERRAAEIAADTLKINLSELFQLIEFLGRNFDEDSFEMGDIIKLLGVIGQSMTAAIRELDGEFKPSAKVLDLSAHPENLNILAEDISKILKNPNLPESTYDCIVQSLNETPDDSIDYESVEVIANNLRLIKTGANDE